MSKLWTLQIKGSVTSKSMSFFFFFLYSASLCQTTREFRICTTSVWFYTGLAKDLLNSTALTYSPLTCRAFNFGECKDGKPQQPLPPALTPHADQIGAFFDYCYRLALRLNTLLGIGLATDPPSFFRDAHLRERGPSGSILRMLHYPPLGDAAGASADDVRAGAHSDYGSLTLLFRLRGQAGLEILTPEGSWAPVPVTPPGTEDDPSPPILVNIGDLLSYWTAGLLRSTVHRVVFPVAGGAEGETAVDPRYSMAFFCHPVGNAALEPVPSERVRAEGLKAAAGEGNPHALKKDEILTADEHLQMRLRASYAGLYGDEGKK